MYAMTNDNIQVYINNDNIKVYIDPIDNKASS